MSLIFFMLGFVPSNPAASCYSGYCPTPTARLLPSTTTIASTGEHPASPRSSVLETAQRPSRTTTTPRPSPTPTRLTSGTGGSFYQAWTQNKRRDESNLDRTSYSGGCRHSSISRPLSKYFHLAATTLSPLSSEPVSVRAPLSPFHRSDHESERNRCMEPATPNDLPPPSAPTCSHGRLWIVRNICVPVRGTEASNHKQLPTASQHHRYLHALLGGMAGMHTLMPMQYNHFSILHTYSPTPMAYY